MKYVYMLKSETHPDRIYVGSTVDLKRRLNEHHSGQSIHTRKFMPWSIIGYHAFSDHLKGDRFEAYLKSGSGRAFTRRHF